MSNAAVPSSPPAPGGVTEPGQDQAPGGLPVGKVLARMAKIPLRRWKLSLVICALSAAAAFFAGKQWSRSSYPAEGKLLYRPKALSENLKPVYTSLTKQTVRDLIKTQSHSETRLT